MSLAKILATVRRNQRWIGLAIIILTMVLFVRFFQQHPQYVTSLTHVSPWAVAEIVVLNALLILTLAVIYQATLALCGHRLSWKEQLLLTSYSSLANFFGPLQSGPGVRAVYLKSKHGVKLRDYTLATLVYYACFAMISALFLFGGSRPWWQSLLGVAAVGLVSYAVISWFARKRSKKDASGFRLRLRPFLVLLAATFVQIVLVTAYYFIEVGAIGIHASLHQIVSYAGAANFAIFVSITPDAVGIRETFLVVAQHLHGLAAGVIVTANVLDRAAYALFLGLLFIVVMSVHAKDRLKIKKTADQ